MATLQTIRSKGPLLVIVIGLALFAFIAGDAWKILQPHQGKQDAGEVNGNTLSVQDYQKMVDEFSEVIKLTNGLNSLSEDQLTNIKDQVWNTYVTNELIAAEAKKLGLKVTDKELQAIIDEGTNPLLMQTPFRNPQTGAFDKDMLKKFLVDYANLDASKMPAQYVEYYQTMGNFWKFVERTLKQSVLAEKYQNLIAKSLISNPVAAEDVFNGRTAQSDLLLAGIPYSSISDSTITVSNDDIKKLYEEKKESFKQPVETRDIKFIDVRVVPSEADRQEVQKEVTEYSNQLITTTNDYTAFIRSTGSVIPFADVPVNKTVLPSDVASRLDSTSVNEVYGPYYNQADEVELFVNGKSQGIKSKDDNHLHVSWRVKYEPGSVKVVARKAGTVVAEKEIRTAGTPSMIRLTPDRNILKADGTDLSFVTVEILDAEGNICPLADNLVRFEVEGNLFIAGVDNGSQTSMERFKDNKRKAFNGKCLVVLQNNGKTGAARLKAISEGLKEAVVDIVSE